MSVAARLKSPRGSHRFSSIANLLSLTLTDPDTGLAHNVSDLAEPIRITMPHRSGTLLRDGKQPSKQTPAR